MDMEVLGNHLRFARERGGYSLERAAEQCGVSEKTIGNIERARANVTLEVLSKIEAGLNVQLLQLIAVPGETEQLRGKAEYYAVLECGESYYTYGILACKNTASGLYLLSVLHDVSTRPGFVMDLVREFTRHQLSAVHLRDAVLDRIP